MQIQVTLLSNRGNAPVSCIVNVDGGKDYFLSHKDEIRKKGIEKICRKRLWGKRELLNYGYLKAIMREYVKGVTEKADAERYEQIKKERGWK